MPPVRDGKTTIAAPAVVTATAAASTAIDGTMLAAAAFKTRGGANIGTLSLAASPPISPAPPAAA